uniref:Putative cellulose synthase A catalytic subunit 3 [UDP-forming] n=1 Tax=Lygus hesperus TaxID=30085 RepID=A0A0A9W9P3_LYGHE
MRWLKGLAVILAVLRVCGAISCYSCSSKNATTCKSIDITTNMENEKVPVVYCKRGAFHTPVGCLKFVGEDIARKRTVVLRGCAQIPGDKSCDALKKLSGSNSIDIHFCSVCNTSLCNTANGKQLRISFLFAVIRLICVKYTSAI